MEITREMLDEDRDLRAELLAEIGICPGCGGELDEDGNCAACEEGSGE
jgi:hypothetical protein